MTMQDHQNDNEDAAALARLRAEAMTALREGRFDLADALLARGDVSLAELTHNLRVHQAELEAQAQELRESNLRLEHAMQQFRHLFEALPQPALVVDRLGVIQRRNAAADAMFGLDADAHLHPALRRLAADAEARYAIHAALEDAQRSGHARMPGVALTDRGGHTRRADLHLERLPGADAPGHASVLAIVVDESERIEAAERLAAGNQLLRQQQRENRALAAVARSTASMVVMTDAQQCITWVNHAFEQASGWALQEIAGRTLQVLHGPATDTATVAQMRRRLDHGEGVAGIEILFHARSGMPYWVMLDMQPLWAEDGTVEGFVSVQHDITERRRAEQALRDAEAYQRAVLDAAPGLVATLRADGRLGSVNAAGIALLQLGEPGDAIGRPFTDFLRGPDIVTFGALLGGALLGEAQTARVEVVGAGGRRLPLELRTGSLSRDGMVSFVVLVGRDVTAEQALAAAHAEKEAAQASNAAKTRFLSQMSHELRTPLNAVLGFTQLMRADVDGGRADATTLRARLAFVEQAGWHLLTMIDDVLDLSRIEAGRVEMHLEPVPLAAMVRDALDLVRGAAERRRIRLAQVGDEALCAVADPVRLKQVLANLLSNAVKYNREGGHVDVALRTAGDEVSIVVQDSGRGLRPEQIAHLFEPFNRLDAPSNVEGSGIGLVIARHLAELMHGRIEVHSTPGEGSTFTLHLPAAPGDSASAPLADDDAAPPPLQRACHVLYIEDIDSNIELMHHVLDGSGWQLSVERTGLTGLERARADHPDLILLDLQLPDVDGVEVRRRLLSDPATAAIPCLAITADVAARHAEPPDVPFDGWLAKPLRIAAMRRALAEAMATA